MNRRRINKLVGALFGIGLLTLVGIDFALAQGQPNCQISSNAQVRWVQYEGGLRPIIENQMFDGGETLTIRDCLDFRVKNCVFKNQENGIAVSGNSRGVIDRNKFSRINTYGITVNHSGPDKGYNSWARPLGLGMAGGLPVGGNAEGKYETADAVYIEDNEFEFTFWHHVASNRGSRYVFRYNKTSDPTRSSQVLDVHGNYFGPAPGSRSWEFYNNHIVQTDPSRRLWAGMALRGGDGIVFNNTFDGNFGAPIDLIVEHRDYPPFDSCDCPYPCEHQIREGYFWNNNFINLNPNRLRPGVKPGSEYILERCPALTQENRDYFLSDPNTVHDPSQSPIPTGSYNYQVTSYTPFCYPHPLVSGVDCDPGNIDPPPNRPPRKPVLNIVFSGTQVQVVTVTASAFQDPNVPDNTIDNLPSTRWSAEGDGQWITFDLGSVHAVSRVGIAWYQGNNRKAIFDIEVSTDNVNWTPVFSGQSSGNTLQEEIYNFPVATARYVRIIGHGNTANMWNSITEVKIYE